MEDAVIGIDGGGTSTRVALVTTDGRVLGMGQSGSGNYQDVGCDAVARHVGAALDEARAGAGAASPRLRAAFFGMAGVVSEADQQAIRRVAASAGLTSPIGIDHDLRIALAGGLGGAPGIVVISGTGSSCYGRTAEGRSWRAGGWGSRLDDVGSSTDLGLRGLTATVRAADGRGEPTVLGERLIKALGLCEVRDLLYKVEGEGLSRSDFGALARTVVTAAAEGDRVARQILKEGVDELALAVQAVDQQLELEKGPDVTAVGGLATSGTPYTPALHAAIRRRVPTARIVEPILPPVLGATMLALDQIGVAVDQALVARLRAEQRRHGGA